MQFTRLGRFEILLPHNYNDGSQIEVEKIAQTRQELNNQFGASTLDSTEISGHWFHQGTLYEDELFRVRVDAPYSRKNRAFFRSYKEVLKERFRQEDIWITIHRIEVL
jgi:hypothetical protein